MAKILPINLDQFSKILKFGTPLQIYDEEIIQNQIRKFKEAFPYANNYFAVKATPNIHILNLFLEHGFGLDCSSMTELLIAKTLVKTPKDIMYTANYPRDDEFKFALELGVRINIDNYATIDMFTKENVPKEISFRYNPPFGKTSSKIASNVLAGKKVKFGISKDKLIDGYRKCKSLGSEIFGIHMMTGSCVLDETYWNSLFMEISEIVLELTKFDITLSWINLGGGFGIPYEPDETELDLKKISELVKEGKDKLKKMVEIEPKIYFENGRYFTAQSGFLIGKCTSIKHDYGNIYVGIDANMANLMRPGMYGAYHHITVIDGSTLCPSTKKIVKQNVVGGLCENNDWFCKDRELPIISKGDLVIIHDTGAHGHSMGFRYNGKLGAPEVLVDSKNKKYRLIRRRETVDDYLATII